MTGPSTAAPGYWVEIKRAAAPFQLDPCLVRAIVEHESSGQADAFRFEPAFYAKYCQNDPLWRTFIPRRVASSYGLMQVMFTTAWGLGFRGEPEELFVPTRSLYYGCRELASLLVWAAGNESKAVAAYNGGRGGWDKPVPQAYARRVLARRDQWREVVAREQGKA